MLKFLFYYLFTNPLISAKYEFWFVNDFSVPVYRPTNIKSFFKTRDYFNSLEKLSIPQYIVKWAVMFGYSDEDGIKPDLDNNYERKVKLYNLDPIIFNKEDIEKYSKYLPLEVTMDYKNHHWFLTKVKNIKEE